MKVYVVMVDNLEDWSSDAKQIYGLYSSKERAEEVCNKASKDSEEIEYYIIEEWLE